MLNTNQGRLNISSTPLGGGTHRPIQTASNQNTDHPALVVFEEAPPRDKGKAPVRGEQPPAVEAGNSGGSRGTKRKTRQGITFNQEDEVRLRTICLPVPIWINFQVYDLGDDESEDFTDAMDVERTLGLGDHQNSPDGSSSQRKMPGGFQGGHQSRGSGDGAGHAAGSHESSSSAVTPSLPVNPFPSYTTRGRSFQRNSIKSMVTYLLSAKEANPSEPPPVSQPQPAQPCQSQQTRPTQLHPARPTKPRRTGPARSQPAEDQGSKETDPTRLCYLVRARTM